MAYLLATKRKSGTQAIITGNATNQHRYANLKSTFSASDLYRVFAEPAESQRDVSWYTDWEVDPNKPVITLGELDRSDPTRASEVRGRVATMMDLFFRTIKKYEQDAAHYRRLFEVLKASFELPEAESNVWLLTDTSGREQVVLTQWGYLKDEFNPPEGIINSWNRLTRRDIQVMIRYAANRQPAPNTTLVFTENSQLPRTETVRSDAGGYALVPNVMPNALLGYHQVDNDGRIINEGTILVGEEDTYEIFLKTWHDFTLLVQQNGKPKPSEEVIVEIDNQPTRATANQEGLINLPAVSAGTAIRVYQEKEGQVINEHRFSADSDQLRLLVSLASAPVGPPRVLVSDTTVILLNQQGQPLAGVLVRFGMSNIYTEQSLSREGAAILPDVAPNQVVTVAYLDTSPSKKTIWQGEFTRRPDQHTYTLTVQKRRWWWLWLLGVLLGLLLLCYLHLMPVCPYCCDQSEVDHLNPVIRTDTITRVDTIMRVDTVTRVDTIMRVDTIQGRVLHRGDITLTLEWRTTDDLDLYLVIPDGTEIYYAPAHKLYKNSAANMEARLEVDANASGSSLTNRPVEHIFCLNPVPGTYKVMVRYYKRNDFGSNSLPFTVKIQVGDNTTTFKGNRSNFSTPGTSSQKLVVKTFTYPQME